MSALRASAEAHEATFSLGTKVISGLAAENSITLNFQHADHSTTGLSAKSVINCAGHGAYADAAAIDGYDVRHLPPRFLAKGSYCSVSGTSPFHHLIYPIPVPGALGVHVTLDMQGQARLAPDIEWVEDEDYSVSNSIAFKFIKACEGFWPEVNLRKLTASYAGIRPKIHAEGQKSADFLVQSSQCHGVSGLINLFGIESPGLTSSIAISNYLLRLQNSTTGECPVSVSSFSN